MKDKITYLFKWIPIIGFFIMFIPTKHKMREDEYFLSDLEAYHSIISGFSFIVIITVMFISHSIKGY